MGAPSVSTPPPRDIGKETRDSLQAQVDLAPQIYQSEQQFRPKYADIEMDILQRTLLGSPGGQQFAGYEPVPIKQIVQVQEGTERVQVRNPNGRGMKWEERPKMVSREVIVGYEQKPIFRQGNGQRGLLDIYERDIYPRMAEMEAAAIQRQRRGDVEAVERLGLRANQAFLRSNPLLETLTEHARGDLALRGRASDEEMREASQAARSAFNDRGMLRSNASVAAEVLGRNSVVRANEDRARAFALELSGRQMDPFMAILGRSGTTPQAASNLMGQGQFTQGAGNKMFGMNQAQFAEYAQDLNNTNFNAQMAANMMNAKAKGDMMGGLIGLGGSVIGGAVAL